MMLDANKCLIGGIDVRPLTFGSVEDVRVEVNRAVELARDCPGYVIACADTIPGNVPLENVYAYFDAVEQCRHRAEPIKHSFAHGGNSQ